MESVIQWLRSTDWLANALGILVPLGGLGVWLWKRPRRRQSLPSSFAQLAASTTQIPSSMTAVKATAKVAIVDDNLSDFPVQELRKAGFQITTYRHVSVSDFDGLADFDAVFLDMHDIVKDDPTEGGLKLIRVLRQKNPRQKICAVSGNQFNPSATAFFKLADDALNKPMSAQRCVEVLEAFLKEKLDAQTLAQSLDRSELITPEERNAAIAAISAAASQRRAASSSQLPPSWPLDVQSMAIDLSRMLIA